MSYLTIPGLEGIDFQKNKKFGLELEVALNKLRKENHVTDSMFAKSGVSKIIKKYTNIKMTTIADTHAFAAIELPPLNLNAVLTRSGSGAVADAAEFDKMLTKNEMVAGSVDLSTGKVSGVFSEIEMKLHISFFLLQKGAEWTVPQVVAFILHEVGHAFYLFEMLGRVTHTNYVMEEATRRLTNTDTKVKRIEILRDLEKATHDFKEIDIEALAATRRDGDHYRVMILRHIIPHAESELGANVYTARGYEQLADAYATRMGYGEALVTGLNKMDKMGQWHHFTNTPVYYMVQVSAIVILGFATLGISLIASTMINPEGGLYDNVGDRYASVRRQLTASLKEKHLSKEQRATILQDINIINNIEDEVVKNESIHKLLWRYVLPYGRSSMKLVELQKDLEQLANNRLTEAAARLTAV